MPFAFLVATMVHHGEFARVPPHAEAFLLSSSSERPVRDRSTNAPTYDLRERGLTSDEYYAEVHRFSQAVYDGIEKDAGGWLEEYRKFVAEREPERSPQEYAVELLSLGVIWRRYSSAAMHTNPRVLWFLSALYAFRQSCPWAKPWLDRLRGLFSGLALAPWALRAGAPAAISFRSFERLMQWLEASGEFEAESKRLHNWYGLCRQRGPSYLSDCVRAALALEAWFASAAAERFGKYTHGVERFLREQHPRYRFREDEILCGKSAEEYHLNMVGAELMNWGLEPAYLETSTRAVLVPGCMRQHQTRCRAVRRGRDVVCVHCASKCRVSAITELGERHGFSVHIILHASSFTRWLKRWERSGTGLIATACLPNLVAGGYQMRELGLAAQCVPLDYCGCRRHWTARWVATDLNQERLLQIARKPPTSAAPCRASV